MKKIMTSIAIVMMALMSQAASINWGASGAIYYGDSVVGIGGAKAYLVYLGSAGSSWTDYSMTINETTGVLESSFVSSGNAGPTSGISKSNTAFPAADAGQNGAYGIVFTTVQSGTVYQFQSQVYTADSSTLYNPGISVYTWKPSDLSTAGHSNWTPVPEPGTAALALAGLALLIRRRK